MPDFQYGQAKPNALVNAGSSVTLQFDYWRLSFNFNILPSYDASGNGSTLSELALNKIVEIISTRGQPVILGAPVFNATTGVSTLDIAIEHNLSWNTNEGTAPVYGLGAAGAATDNGAAAFKAALLAGLVNLTWFYTGETGTFVQAGGDTSAYPAWAAATTYVAGQVVSANSNYYLCVLGGTSISGDAPTGTGSTGTAAITTADNIVWWYLAPTSAGTPPSVQYLVNTPTYFSNLP